MAWDNNEARGTLGMRAEPSSHRRTVVDLLNDIDEFLATPAGIGWLAGYLRPQSARSDVLPSDETPGGMEVIYSVAVKALWTALSRDYRLLVVNTGHNVRAPNWQAITELPDCLVVPTTVQRDVADNGLWMLDHLAHSGKADLAPQRRRGGVLCGARTDPELLESIV